LPCKTVGAAESAVGVQREFSRESIAILFFTAKIVKVKSF